jgi:TonB family protein
LITFASVTAWAGSVKIIANAGLANDQISARELRSVFLRERSSLNNGTHVEPVLEKTGPAHEAFLKQYLSQDNDELLRHYQNLLFTGKGSMPKVVASDEEVLAYVARTKGAIGYVSAEASTPGVKALDVVEESNNSERRLLTRVAPDYPEALRSRSIGGLVRLKMIVSPNGEVEEAAVLGGNPILAEAAVAAVHKWKYAPASSRTTMEVTIPFKPQQ